MEGVQGHLAESRPATGQFIGMLGNGSPAHVHREIELEGMVETESLGILLQRLGSQEIRGDAAEDHVVGFAESFVKLGALVSPGAFVQLLRSEAVQVPAE